MKKYITIAALLSAGTALANAESIVTTFSSALSGKTPTEVVLEIAGAPEGTTGEVSSLTKADRSEISLRTVTGKEDGTFLAPDTNVGSAQGWKSVFEYTFSGETIIVSGVTLNVGIFSGGNTWQGVNTNRDFVFEVGLGDKTITSGNWTVQGNGTQTPGNGAVTLSFDDAVELKDSATFSLSVSKGTSNPGCFLGLHSVEFSVVPEPSAFGMLAGLGALALVASRRRRK